MPRRLDSSGRTFGRIVPVELALFDFDHTITTGDSYGRFLRRVATPQQLEGFNLEGYAFAAGASSPERLVFRRKTAD